MTIEIKNLPKLSFNTYNHQHWSKKKEFKDSLRWLMAASTKVKLKGGYDIYFDFHFKGRKLDTINVIQYCKIIDDQVVYEGNTIIRI